MKTFPATGPDVFCHLLRTTGDSTLRSVVIFRGRLDVDSLRLSVDDIIRTERIFSSRLEDDGQGWMRWVEESGIKGDVCIVEHEDALADPDPYCLIPVEDDVAPPLRLNLVHGEVNDSLVISSPHSVLDGKGMKELTKRILRGCYDPTSHGASEGIGTRSEKPIWDALGEEVVERIEEDGEWPYCSWPSMYNRAGREGGIISFRRVPISFINDARRTFGKSVTLHDMLMAAFYWSLREITGIACCSVSSTVDNRRYFPEGFKVPIFANLSSNYSIPIPSGIESLKEIILHISESHRKMKGEWIGLANLLSLSRAKDMDDAVSGITEMKGDDHSGFGQYFLSNLGIMDIDDETIDALGIEDAYCTYPGVDPPTLGITVSTFKGIMNLNTGIYDGADRGTIEMFLDMMVECLNGRDMLEDV